MALLYFLKDWQLYKHKLQFRYLHKTAKKKYPAQ